VNVGLKDDEQELVLAEQREGVLAERLDQSFNPISPVGFYHIPGPIVKEIN